MSRYRLIGASLVAALTIALTFASSAFAGSYLDRATLLLDGSERDLKMVREHLGDKELATMVEAIADARLKAASKMEIPTVVAKAHPHLLLVLEHTERAADSARDGNVKAALEHLDDADREDKMFRAQLSELGFPLPSSR
jgi:hypothetical protein